MLIQCDPICMGGDRARAEVLDFKRTDSDQIDGFLLKVFVTVMEERSASRAAIRLNVPQPTISAALGRLRRALGDPLLVRGRKEMVPTEHAMEVFATAKKIIDDLESLCSVHADPARQGSRRSFAIGSFDYVSPDFVPLVVADVLKSMPGAMVQVHSLSVDKDYQAELESGGLDLVIGNWGEPSEQLRRRMLFSDEIVCLMRRGHPLADGELTEAKYLSAAHAGLIPYHVDRLGVIDAYLAKLGLRRDIRVVLPTFNGIAHLLTETDLIFTTCRSFLQGHARGLPLAVVPAPALFPPMSFYLLWHERSHYSRECRVLRSSVARAVLKFRSSSRPMRVAGTRNHDRS
jgi:DNA-binding transcriptional LysR family regulator